MEVLFGPSHDSEAVCWPGGDFPGRKRITHRFIRNLLKTDCNIHTTLIAHHHIAVGHDRI
jgi:hypothetical protein